MSISFEAKASIEQMHGGKDDELQKESVEERLHQPVSDGDHVKGRRKEIASTGDNATPNPNPTPG